jgi:hypothetical protein
MALEQVFIRVLGCAVVSIIPPVVLVHIRVPPTLYILDEASQPLFVMIYLLTAIGLTPGDRSTVQYSTVRIYTQTIRRTTQ